MPIDSLKNYYVPKKNRLFYTLKFNSSFIIKNKCNVKRDFYQAFKANMIISLADSQMLKTIRNITGHNVDLEQLEEWYIERDKIKKRKNSLENKEKIRYLQSNIYNMMYIPEYITVVIEDNKHYEKFFKKGFYFNDHKYTRFSCSASQARVSTVVFVKDDIKQELKTKLDNGRNMDKPISPSKYNAYFGLNSSAIKTVTKPRFCIVPDYIENDKVDVDFVIETNDYDDDIIEPKTIDVEFNRFDGSGLITPQFAEKWSKDLGLDYIACQFCIRYSFAKGMLNTFDILQFCEEKNNGNYIITDIFDKQIDLRNIDVVLTESQCKLWDSWSSQEEYEKCCEENGFVFGVTRFTPKEDDKILITNYQFLQTLNMSDDDIKELCKDTVDYIQGVSYKNFYYTILFMLGENMSYSSIQNYMKSSDNYWLKSLICNPNLLNDKYSKEKIRDCIIKRIEQSCIGKIMVDGNFQVLVPDSYAFMEYLCGMPVKGLLASGQCYSKFWKDRKANKILSQRSPLTHFSECHVLDVKTNEEIDKWFKYCYTGFIVNTHDISTMMWAGSDWDYDLISSTNNSVMINSVYKNQKPVTYDIPKPFKKILIEQDLYNSDVQTFGSLIGPLTNHGTSIIALIKEFENDEKKYKLLNNRLKMVCAGQSKQIDRAKIGQNVKGIPKIWKTFQRIQNTDTIQDIEKKEWYNSILSDKKPYFFKYLYSSERKKYQKYCQKSNEYCIDAFGITLKELLKKEMLNQEEQKFVTNFHKYNGFINSDCEMNRICKHIENVDFNIKEKIRDVSEFDYTYLMSNNIWDENTYNQIKNFFIEKIKIFKMHVDNKLTSNSPNAEGKIDFSILNQNVLFYENIKNELLEICSNEKELTDYFIHLFYVEKKSWNKSHVWKLFGEQIYQNCLEKCNGIINFPIKINEDFNSSNLEIIDFCKNKFLVTEVDLNNEIHPQANDI